MLTPLKLLFLVLPERYALLRAFYVFDALERAERELKTATESLSVVGHQLDALRAVVQDGESCIAATALEQRQPEVASSTASRDSSSGRLTLSVSDPPGLLLHQHNLQKRKNKQAAQPRFRRVSNVHAAAASGDLRLHGRWMELSTEASQGEAGRAGPNKARTAFRSRTATMDDLASANLTSKLPILHPQGLFKLCWDLLALTLLLNDCILLPMSLAWDFSMTDDGIGGTVTAVSFYVSLVFWSADLPVNLNTAIYIRGRLVMHRRSILWHYSRSWMMFDVFVLSLDYGYLLLSTDVVLLRFVRILRVVRLVRIVKLSKLNTIIEESAASAGRQWVTLVVAITKTAVMMLTTAHFLTCAWFYIGLNLGPELPSLSWVEIAQIAERPETRGLNASSTDDDWSPAYEVVAHSVPGFIQYMHSLRWIMNSPSPPEMSAGSGVEWGFDILISVTTLVVIGSAISKISGTTAELRAMNEESDRRRRDVRLYLAGQSVSYELVTRIMRFVDYKLEKFSTNTLDASLISPTLQLELYVSQRANYVSRIPIFALLQECYPDVFGSVCAALTKNFFEKGEPVFQAGSYATSLQLTSTGTYSYQDQSSFQTETLEGSHWFGELSLFAESTIHQSTLIPTSFAETYSLHGSELVACVKSSRGAASMLCEYAKDFVAAMQKTESKHGDEDQILQGENCCKQNQQFQALYPDPKKLFSNIIVHVAETQSPKKDEEDLLELGEDLVAATKLHKTASSGSLVLSRLTSESSTLTNGSGAAHARVESTADPGLQDFVNTMLHQGLDAEQLPHQLEKHIPELHPVWSPHNIFEQAGERERGSSSCISVLALVKNRYDIFTEPQGKNVKLKQSQWEELQELVTWIEPDAQQLQAVLVLLAIRALGKSKALLQQLPVESRRPERAVVQVMNGYENVVPSLRWLTQRSQTYVEEALLTHELFNLAQMLQGENCPANVKQLREHIELKGDAVFRFYILFLLGFMSGLAAGNGSRFMNAKNADSTIGGIRMLQRLMNVNPTSIYWGYMGLRATKLKLPFDTPEDMVLIRLACLARIQDDRGYQALKHSWAALGARERTSLTDHFLADGIEEPAWVFEFLPNCVANAQANPVVGLTALLDVLTDLLYNLRSFDKSGKPSLMLVDLSDMGEFIAAVQNRFVFLTCISRSQLSIEKSRVRVEMSGGNWGRTTDPDTDLTSIAYTLQDLVQKQQFVEERLSQ
ncbi:HCN4 [Symbiodinium sp. CCMP2456]|nr:HCN4 [Symbiodinium sp. CCMP2456]